MSRAIIRLGGSLAAGSLSTSAGAGESPAGDGDVLKQIRGVGELLRGKLEARFRLLTIIGHVLVPEYREPTRDTSTFFYPRLNPVGFFIKGCVTR
jgi:hypothetical protein